METESKQNNLAISIAIVVAGVLIAGAVYLGSRGEDSSGVQLPAAEAESLDEMRPAAKDDHIRGNPDAPVKIVEYSDAECPFCKSFHSTMQRVVDEYGASGKAAWVYRHFPLDNIHPKADKEAEATECAAELGGNGTFWAYVDRLF